MFLNVFIFIWLRLHHTLNSMSSSKNEKLSCLDICQGPLQINTYGMYAFVLSAIRLMSHNSTLSICYSLGTVVVFMQRKRKNTKEEGIGSVSYLIRAQGLIEKVREK